MQTLTDERIVRVLATFGDDATRLMQLYNDPSKTCAQVITQFRNETGRKFANADVQQLIVIHGKGLRGQTIDDSSRNKYKLRGTYIFTTKQDVGAEGSK